jgi:hypothetical protein
MALGALLVFLGACGGATASLDDRTGDASSAPDAVATDGRADGCTGTPPILECADPCGGPSSPEQAVCEGPLGWSCPPPSAGCGFADFRCGEDGGYCEVIRQYCAIDRHSPPQCMSLPADCTSCDCVDAGSSPHCQCTDDGGITVTCTSP